MAYRIEYAQTAAKTDPADKPFRRITAMTAGFFVLFLILVHACWPQGRQFLQDLLIPGDTAITLQAMETFVDELRFGSSFSAAAKVFCREILTHADIY